MTLDEIVKSETCIKSYTIEKEKSDNFTFHQTMIYMV